MQLASSMVKVMLAGALRQNCLHPHCHVQLSSPPVRLLLTEVIQASLHGQPLGWRHSRRHISCEAAVLESDDSLVVPCLSLLPVAATAHAQ